MPHDSSRDLSMPVLLHQSTNSVHTPQQSGHTIFQNAQQGWCGWHKIDRNLTSDAKYKSILVHEKNKSILTRVEIDLIVKWLWYFIKHYENSDEVEFSMMLLNYYQTSQTKVFILVSLKREHDPNFWSILPNLSL